MPYNFQFTFLGCQHNYLARVTKISNEGVPQDASLTRTYGLPTAFVDKMNNKHHQKRFYYNVRGHDFLSYSGQYRGRGGRDDVGHVETAYVPISESSLLESLRLENVNSPDKFLGANMITTLGPTPGSLFVKAYSLRRFEWENLPPRLNRELHRIITSVGYQDCGFKDLTMSALGGWVVLLNKGKNYSFGGHLPHDLRIILQNAQQSQIDNPKLDRSIYRCYLNHQHPEEYVLIFGDGQCYVKLHAEFEASIRFLLTTWGSSHKRFDINFTPSSTSSATSQQALNALYYSRRGLFFLSRLNEELALHYLREASHQNKLSHQIREHYCIAIIAMRRKREPDHVLQNMINKRPQRLHTHRPPPPRPGNHDEDSFFRDEYMWMLDEPEISIPLLERKLDALQRQFLDHKNGLVAAEAVGEWGYEQAVAKSRSEGGEHELDGTDMNVLDPAAAVEVEGEVVARMETRVSELEDETDELEVLKQEAVPVRNWIVLDEPRVGVVKKSKNPFVRLKRWGG